MIIKVVNYCIVISLTIFSHISSISSHNHGRIEFCANNQLFSFSGLACPGGILLKEPMELTEPCHCINKYLTVYSDCRTGDGHNYPSKVCHPSTRSKEKRNLIKLLQPSISLFNGNYLYPGVLQRDLKCERALVSCARSPSREFLHFPQNLEKASLSEKGEPHHREKRDMSIYNVVDSLGVMRARIKETIEFLNELQFGSEDGKGRQPKSMSMQMLKQTVGIFNSITPKVIVNDDTMISILTLFLEKYAGLELPGRSGNLEIDDLLDKRTFDEVMAKLGECASKASDPSEEFEFTSTNPGICPAEIESSIYKVPTAEFGIKRVKRRLGELMPFDRKYFPEEEDFLLGALWKVFDSVYSYCFPYLFTFHSAQIFVNYHNIMENIFTHPLVIKDFYAKDGQGTIIYSSRIDHENLTALMKNIDFMDEAIHFVSKYKQFFLKPKNFIKPRSAPLRPGDSNKPSFDGINGEEPNYDDLDLALGKTRTKRSIPNSDPDWKSFEIWEGRAYCLQLANPKLSPSLANTYPNIDNFCL